MFINYYSFFKKDQKVTKQSLIVDVWVVDLPRSSLLSSLKDATPLRGTLLWLASVYKVLQQYVVDLSLSHCKAFWRERPLTSGWGPCSDDTPSLSACGYHAGRRKRSASRLHPGQEGVFYGGIAVIITANICQTFLLGQPCSTYLTWTCSYDCHCRSVRDGCCYDPFYRWRYRGTGRLSSLLEVTQTASNLGSQLCRLGAPQCFLTLCLS